MKHLMKFFIFVTVISLSLWSCKTSVDTTGDQATSQDVRAADLAVSDVFTFTSDQTDNTSKALSDSTAGMRVNTAFDSTFMGFITTITFTNYTPNDGITRNGQIIIKWNKGWFLDTLKYVDVTFNKFTRDSMSLSGELKIRKTLAFGDSSMHPGRRVDAINMVITYPDNSTIKWNGWRTILWKSGWLTFHDRSDNVFEINWHKKGTNRLGKAFTGDGRNLILDMSCKKDKFTAGTITITKADGKKFTIDYGDGACDGTYTITSGKNTVQINQ